MEAKHERTKLITTAKPPATATSNSIVTGHRDPAQFDVASLDADELRHIVSVALANGDAIAFSLTGDGGALSTTLLRGTERTKGYAKSPDHALTVWHDMREECYP